MIKNKKIGVVILAAGSSSRLGYAKQLVEFKGKSLLQHIIDASAQLEFDAKILVLGARKEKIEKEIELKGFEIIVNEKWELGMSTSLIAGLKRALEIENDLQQLLILLSDQLFVNQDKIEELIDEHLKGNSPATFSEYAGNVGVPAIFSSEVFQYLKELKGDHGAKKLIHENKFYYRTLKFEEANFDVDTAEDVERLKKLEEK